MLRAMVFALFALVMPALATPAFAAGANIELARKLVGVWAVHHDEEGGILAGHSAIVAVCENGELKFRVVPQVSANEYMDGRTSPVTVLDGNRIKYDENYVEDGIRFTGRHVMTWTADGILKDHQDIAIMDHRAVSNFTWRRTKNGIETSKDILTREFGDAAKADAVHAAVAGARDRLAAAAATLEQYAAGAQDAKLADFRQKVETIFTEQAGAFDADAATSAAKRVKAALVWARGVAELPAPSFGKAPAGAAALVNPGDCGRLFLAEGFFDVEDTLKPAVLLSEALLRSDVPDAKLDAEALAAYAKLTSALAALKADTNP